MSPVSEQLSDLSKCCKQDDDYIRLNNGIAVSATLQLFESLVTSWGSLANIVMRTL